MTNVQDILNVMVEQVVDYYRAEMMARLSGDTELEGKLTMAVAQSCRWAVCGTARKSLGDNDYHIFNELKNAGLAKVVGTHGKP